MSKVEPIDDDSAQSVQFYKIKLMEKESQLTTLQAKFKKIEFKHARQLKQAKIDTERAKDLLKQQKQKLDKISKVAAENQEQNNLLQTRLIDLKQQKDKQVQNIRMKYNKIKQQVRSYQRILPTHTFLTDLQITIDQLPTYQDTFINLRQKCQMHDQLQSKYQNYKIQMEEKLKTSTKNVQFITNKNKQLEQAFKQMVDRCVQLQANVLTFKKNQEQLKNQVYQLIEENTRLKLKQQQIEQENKYYQNKIQKIIHQHNSQIQLKQQQLMKFTQEQSTKHEEELSQLHSRYQQKQKILVNQMLILEQENNLLQSKIQKERERYQQSYLELKEQIQQVIKKQQQLKKNNDLLANNNQQLKQYLEQLTGINKKLQDKNINSQKQIKQLKEKIIINNQKQQAQQDKIKNNILKINQFKQTLTLKIQQLEIENAKIIKQKKQKQNQNIILIHQLEEIKLKYQYDGKRKSFDKIPSQLEMFQRGSTQIEDNNINRSSAEYQEIIIQNNPLDSKNQKYQKNNQQQHKNQQIIQMNININKLKEQINLINIKYKQQSQRYQSLIIQYKQQKQQLKKQIIILQNNNGIKNKQLKQFQQNDSRYKKDITQLNQQINSLKKNIWLIKQNQQQTNIQNQRLYQQLKKQTANKIEFNKNFKQLQKQLETQKKLNIQLNDSLKLKQEHIKSKEETIIINLQKEKTYKIDINQLSVSLNQTKDQIVAIKKQSENRDQELIEKKKIIDQQQKIIAELKRNIEHKIEQDNLKDRQIEMMKESLTRQRKERTLRVVPSLQNLDITDNQENFIKHYNLAGQKQGEIYLLQRQVSDLKEEIVSINKKHQSQIESLDTQMNQYIQEIIRMKIKVAESEMRASQKQYLYNQIKKKIEQLQKIEQ